MSRSLRYIPEGGSLVEVTTRTIQSRLLLTPNPLLNRIIPGVLARASRLYAVGVVAHCFLSNHYHLILWVPDAEKLASFMGFFNSKLAQEVIRLTGWKDKVWSRRYQSIPISEEEAAQIGRLRYILAHGVKEGLVEKVSQWPGVHAASTLLSGQPLEGTWFNRSRQHAARVRGKDASAEHFAEEETLSLVPLPCWKDLSAEMYRARIARMVEEIETEAAAQREQTGRKSLGVHAILRQDPRTEPNETKKSPAPRFHAFRKRIREELYEAYAWFVSAFRDAAEKLKAGDRTASFPLGSFPPRLPFVQGLTAAVVASG
jgi:REP element-mobilizing transposase RayT